MKKILHFFTKSIAISLCICMLASDLYAYAASQTSSVSGQVEDGRWKAEGKDIQLGQSFFQPSTFRLPPELGTVEEVYVASQPVEGRSMMAEGPAVPSTFDPQPSTIIYIQDAHSSLEAQKNIASMIDHLVETQGVKTVYEEGYEGEVPSDEFFGRIEDPEVREKTAYFYLDQLRLGAAEYAHVNRKKDFRLIGADVEEAYQRGLQAYRDHVLNQPKIAKRIDHLETRLANIALHLDSKEFLQWKKNRKAYLAHKLSVTDYLMRTVALLGPHAFEVEEFSLLNRLIEMSQSENKYQEAALEDISFQDFERELKALESRVLNHFLRSEAQRKLWEYQLFFEILRDLNQFKLSPEKFEKIESDLKRFKVKKLAEFLAAHESRAVYLERDWEHWVQRAMDFYEAANRRHDGIKLALNEFAQSEEKIAVLVYGGFHRPSIEALLKSQRMNYVVLSPKIHEVSSRHEAYYKTLMSRGWHSHEQGLAAGLFRAQNLYGLEKKEGSMNVLSDLNQVTEVVRRYPHLKKEDLVNLIKSKKSEMRSKSRVTQTDVNTLRNEAGKVTQRKESPIPADSHLIPPANQSPFPRNHDGSRSEMRATTETDRASNQGAEEPRLHELDRILAEIVHRHLNLPRDESQKMLKLIDSFNLDLLPTAPKVSHRDIAKFLNLYRLMHHPMIHENAKGAIRNMAPVGLKRWLWKIENLGEFDSNFSKFRAKGNFSSLVGALGEVVIADGLQADARNEVIVVGDDLLLEGETDLKMIGDWDGEKALYLVEVKYDTERELRQSGEFVSRPSAHDYFATRRSHLKQLERYYQRAKILDADGGYQVDQYELELPLKVLYVTNRQFNRDSWAHVDREFHRRLQERGIRKSRNRMTIRNLNVPPVFDLDQSRWNFGVGDRAFHQKLSSLYEEEAMLEIAREFRQTLKADSRLVSILEAQENQSWMEVMEAPVFANAAQMDFFGSIRNFFGAPVYNNFLESITLKPQPAKKYARQHPIHFFLNEDSRENIKQNGVRNQTVIFEVLFRSRGEWVNAGYITLYFGKSEQLWKVDASSLKSFPELKNREDQILNWVPGIGIEDEAEFVESSQEEREAFLHARKREEDSLFFETQQRFIRWLMQQAGMRFDETNPAFFDSLHASVLTIEEENEIEEAVRQIRATEKGRKGDEAESSFALRAAASQANSITKERIYRSDDTKVGAATAPPNVREAITILKKVIRSQYSKNADDFSIWLLGSEIYIQHGKGDLTLFEIEARERKIFVTDLLDENREDKVRLLHLHSGLTQRWIEQGIDKLFHPARQVKKNLEVSLKPFHVNDDLMTQIWDQLSDDAIEALFEIRENQDSDFFSVFHLKPSSRSEMRAKKKRRKLWKRDAFVRALERNLKGESIAAASLAKKMRYATPSGLLQQIRNFGIVSGEVAEVRKYLESRGVYFKRNGRASNQTERDEKFLQEVAGHLRAAQEAMPQEPPSEWLKKVLELSEFKTQKNFVSKLRDAIRRQEALGVPNDELKVLYPRNLKNPPVVLTEEREWLAQKISAGLSKEDKIHWIRTILQMVEDEELGVSASYALIKAVRDEVSTFSDLDRKVARELDLSPGTIHTSLVGEPISPSAKRGASLMGFLAEASNKKLRLEGARKKKTRQTAFALTQIKDKYLFPYLFETLLSTKETAEYAEDLFKGILRDSSDVFDPKEEQILRNLIRRKDAQYGTIGGAMRPRQHSDWVKAQLFGSKETKRADGIYARFKPLIQADPARRNEWNRLLHLAKLSDQYFSYNFFMWLQRHGHIDTHATANFEKLMLYDAKNVPDLMTQKGKVLSLADRQKILKASFKGRSLAIISTEIAEVTANNRLNERSVDIQQLERWFVGRPSSLGRTGAVRRLQDALAPGSPTQEVLSVSGGFQKEGEVLLNPTHTSSDRLSYLKLLSQRRTKTVKFLALAERIARQVDPFLVEVFESAHQKARESTKNDLKSSEISLIFLSAFREHQTDFARSRNLLAVLLQVAELYRKRIPREDVLQFLFTLLNLSDESVKRPKGFANRRLMKIFSKQVESLQPFPYVLGLYKDLIEKIYDPVFIVSDESKQRRKRTASFVYESQVFDLDLIVKKHEEHFFRLQQQQEIVRSFLGDSEADGWWPLEKIMLYIAKRYPYMMKTFPDREGERKMNPEGMDYTLFIETIHQALQEMAYDYDPPKLFDIPSEPVSDSVTRAGVIAEARSSYNNLQIEILDLQKKIEEITSQEEAAKKPSVKKRLGALARKLKRKEEEQEYVLLMGAAHNASDGGRVRESNELFERARMLRVGQSSLNWKGQRALFAGFLDKKLKAKFRQHRKERVALSLENEIYENTPLKDLVMDKAAVDAAEAQLFE